VSASSTGSRISLLIIAHNPLLRDDVARLLNEQPDISALASEPAWDAVQSLLDQTKPGLILLDSSLGPRYSLRIRDAIRDLDPAPRMIVMDLLGAPDEVLAFVQAGCSGLILKDATLVHFLTTIRSVAQGLAVLPPALAQTIFSYVVRRSGGRGIGGAREASLTPRERDVVALIAEGESNKEIAERLHIAVHTVKSHVHVILEKLELHSRLEIAAYAHRKPISRPHRLDRRD